MKIIAYTKPYVLRIKALQKSTSVIEDDHTLDSFTNLLIQEIGKKTEPGKVAAKELEVNKELSYDSQKSIWKTITKYHSNSGIILVDITPSRENFNSFLDACKELNVNIDLILNLSLQTKEIKSKALNIIQRNKTKESIPESEFVQKMLSHEEMRLEFVNNIRREIKVTDINANQSQEQMEEIILGFIN